MRTDGLFDPVYAQLERILDLRVEQHSVLSSNLANSNTPNYRAKELDFSEVLGEIMNTPSDGLNMSRTHGAHLGGAGGADAGAPMIELEPSPWSLDGNSVNPEHELVKVMENNLMYNAVTKVTSKKLALLKSVVADGR